MEGGVTEGMDQDNEFGAGVTWTEGDEWKQMDAASGARMEAGAGSGASPDPR